MKIYSEAVSYDRRSCDHRWKYLCITFTFGFASSTFESANNSTAHLELTNLLRIYWIVIKDCSNLKLRSFNILIIPRIKSGTNSAKYVELCLVSYVLSDKFMSLFINSPPNQTSSLQKLQYKLLPLTMIHLFTYSYYLVLGLDDNPHRSPAAHSTHLHHFSSTNRLVLCLCRALWIHPGRFKAQTIERMAKVGSAESLLVDRVTIVSIFQMDSPDNWFSLPLNVLLWISSLDQSERQVSTC